MEGNMSYDEDQINYNIINGITNDDYDDEDDEILIENEIQNVSLLFIFERLINTFLIYLFIIY